MNKPTIFFSHSSLDKDVLSRLKELFVDKTGGTIEVFLSSDGQSIPMGQNWVHRIQDALNQNSLMFVFITPNSINSNWIYFEAGFAYSKNISVVPIGFLGIDLSIISPPMSLLQGFNIFNKDGLNNLIAVINRTYSYNHKTLFTDSNYQDIIFQNNFSCSNPLGEYLKYIENLTVRQKNTHNSNNIPSQHSITRIIEILENEGLKHRINKNSIETFEMTIYSPIRNQPYIFLFDPLLIEFVIPLIVKILLTIYPKKESQFVINFFFNNLVGCNCERIKLTSYLFGTDVVFGENDNFIYNGLTFSVYKYDKKEDKACLSADFIIESFELGQLLDLIHLLFQKKVLYKKSNKYI